jgi:hypothetical protein
MRINMNMDDLQQRRPSDKEPQKDLNNDEVQLFKAEFRPNSRPNRFTCQMTE